MEGCQGLSRAGIWGDKERERDRARESVRESKTKEGNR